MVKRSGEAAQYTRMFEKSNRDDLTSMKRSGIVKFVDIIASPDSCPSCKQLERNSPYPINKVPKIPHPDCSHSIGWCRCVYGAHIE